MFNDFLIAETRQITKVSEVVQRLVIQVFIDYRSAGTVGELRRAVNNATALAPRPIDFSILISAQPTLLQIASELGLVNREVASEDLIEPWGIAKVRNHLLADATVLISPDLDVEWRIAHLGVLAAGEI